MVGDNRIAVVDDDGFSRTLLAKILEDGYEVLTFDSGESFLEAMPEVSAVLLDIEMTGIDGYEVCRRFRMKEGQEHVPLIFVSAHDEPERRLAAFECGGDDFIIKPIVRNEVRYKVETLIAREARIRELESESDMARRMAFSAMTSMGDLGVVLEFMRGSANVVDYRALADALCVALNAWGLKGAIQIRGDGLTFQRATESEDHPLQGSVMENLKDMGRIFQLSSRGIINYPHVSLLVQNLPVEDPDKVGQLRDLLAMLAESADARVVGIDLQKRAAATKEIAQESIEELRAMLLGISSKNRTAQGQVSLHMQDLVEDVFLSLKSMSMTPVQEGMISDLMQAGIQDILHIIDNAMNLEDDFRYAIGKLERLY